MICSNICVCVKKCHRLNLLISWESLNQPSVCTNSGKESLIETLEAIADLFNVDMNFLLGKVGSELSPKDERDIAKDLNRIMTEIKKGNNGPLYYNGIEMDDASINLLQNAIEYALRETKKENKVKYNPNKNKK